MRLVLACPRCRGALDSRDRYRLCARCAHPWQVDADGVVCLEPLPLASRTWRSEGVDLRELSEKLAEETDSDIDRDLDIATRLEGCVAGFSYVKHLDPARADWTMLGDFHERHVLHLGTAFGSLPLQLAATAKELITVDPRYERVRVTSQLARKKGVGNVTSVHGEITDLPIAEGAVDRIAATDALEHAASFYPESGPARGFQIRWLRHLRTRLAPRGELWLAENNRLAAQHFVGRTRPGGVPFGPLLPGAVSARVHALTKGARRPSRLASERDLTKMLHEAGFRECEFHYVVADYERPRFIASSAHDGMITSYLEAVRPGGSRAARLATGLMSAADRLGIVGTFAPSFVIRAIA